MSLGLVLSPEAETDIADAAKWYEEQRPGLSLEFRAAVDEAFSGIEKNPRLHAPIHRTLRRALVRRFPYGVFYVERARDIMVVAVLHTSRNPRLWRVRYQGGG